MLQRPKVVKGVIPAAGFGTRMLPATKVLPKEMLPVAGKPLIQYAVEEAIASGIETVVVVVRGHQSLIRAHFERNFALESFLARRKRFESIQMLRRLSETIALEFVLQERPLGLAHAICCARPRLGQEPFVVLLPDVIVVSEIPVTGQLIREYEEQPGSVVAIRSVEPHEASRHGILRIEREFSAAPCGSVRIAGLVEKPSPEDTPSLLGVFGRYLLEPAIWDAIGRTSPDESGEVQLTDALNLLCQTEVLSGFCFEGQHYDAGDREGYLRANIELSLREPELRGRLSHYFSQLQTESSINS
jgi:UTP--glucose-1-phosphate uridylyltransferase